MTKNTLDEMLDTITDDEKFLKEANRRLGTTDVHSRYISARITCTDAGPCVLLRHANGSGTKRLFCDSHPWIADHVVRTH